MSTMRSDGSAGVRIERGITILAAARTLDLKPVARQMKRFVSAQGALVKSEAVVRKAEEQLRGAQEVVALADSELDRRVEEAASALVAAGAPRLKPFSAIGRTESPGSVRKLPYEKQPKVCLEIAKKLEAHPSPAVKKAGKALREAATKVQKALGPVPAKEKAFFEAVRARLGPEQGWVSAFVALKDGTRSARHDGAPHLFSTLFEKTADAQPKRTPKPKKPKPEQPS